MNHNIFIVLASLPLCSFGRRVKNLDLNSRSQVDALPASIEAAAALLLAHAAPSSGFQIGNHMRAGKRADGDDIQDSRAGNPMMADGELKVTVLFGPPGSGKGTHGPNIEDRLSTPSLSTGDMLRAAVSEGTEIGLKAKEIMTSGGLVGDDIVMGIIKDRIAKDDCSTGFIFDGFPRTVKQAEMLDELLAENGNKVGMVIELCVPDEVLEERICGRWIHKPSGRSYHVKFNKPNSLGDAEPSEATMLDDETSEPLMQRADDTAEALRKRLQGYHDETEPILARYASCAVRIDANQDLGKVWADIDGKLPKSEA